MSYSPSESNPLVCFCFNITEAEVMAVIQRDDVTTIFDVMAHCKAGNGCSSCWPLLEELITLKPPPA